MLDDKVKKAVSVQPELLVRDVWEVAGCPTALKAVSCLWTEVLIPSIHD